MKVQVRAGKRAAAYARVIADFPNGKSREVLVDI